LKNQAKTYEGDIAHGLQLGDVYLVSSYRHQERRYKPKPSGHHDPTKMRWWALKSMYVTPRMESTSIIEVSYELLARDTTRIIAYIVVEQFEVKSAQQNTHTDTSLQL